MYQYYLLELHFHLRAAAADRGLLLKWVAVTFVDLLRLALDPFSKS